MPPPPSPPGQTLFFLHACCDWPNADWPSAKQAGQRSAHRELLAQNIPPELPCMSLSKLPAGKIGKLLVFESGKVKMQIGEVLLDVQPGVPCGFRQVTMSSCAAPPCGEDVAQLSL